LKKDSFEQQASDTEIKEALKKTGCKFENKKKTDY
jgi:hypothetical protein